MVNTILNSESVSRLNETLRSRYGKTLKIQWIQSLSSQDLWGRSSHQIINHELRIPISTRDHFFAMAVIPDIRGLTTEDHVLIVELVKLVLEPEFYNWYLKQISHNAQSAVQADNLVSIFSPHQLHSQSESTPSLPLDSTQSTSAKVLFFQLTQPPQLSRLASETHEVSQNWAFLHFRDIQSQVQTTQDLKLLGSLTLVIDDLLELNPQQQELIYEYLISCGPKDEPLLVVGSTSTLEDLEIQDRVHSGLMQILKQHRLEADRLPQDPQLRHQTLEIMLEN